MTTFYNGRILVQHGKGAQVQSSFTDSIAVANGQLTHVGTRHDAPSSTSETVDLKQRLVVPGFVDGHMHLLLLGQSLAKLDLTRCVNLDDIRKEISAYAAAHPSAERIMCRGWLQSMTNGEARADMLDDLDPRPIFVDSKDLHSTWCNTAALDDLGAKDMADPPGGTIHRDANGKATGLLSEAAALNLVWPHLSKVASLEARIQAMRNVVSSYVAAGYTGVVDMAMDEHAWEAIQELRSAQDVPLRISAFWLILPRATEAENVAQVDRAAELQRRFNTDTSPNCRIVGIKVICDGVVDACTAALSETYGMLTSTVDPLWSEQQLAPVVRRAAEAGLQCALHAIGDAAVTMAINVIEAHGRPEGGRGDRRHRIEHLELTSPEDAKRLGQLGITASIQPVHADPSILRAWPKLLGEQRLTRAFAYTDFEAGGAVLAMGSDAPTAPFLPLQNLYVATTRRSSRDVKDTTMVNPEYALALDSAFAAATRGSACSVFAEGYCGSLQVGLSADFVVLEMQWASDGLLKAQIRETWFRGKRVWSAEKDGRE